MKYLKLYENIDFEETWIQEEEYNKFEKGDIVNPKDPYEVYHYIINEYIDSLNKTYDKRNWISSISFNYVECLITDVGILNGIDVIKISGHWPWFKAECFELAK